MVRAKESAMTQGARYYYYSCTGFVSLLLQLLFMIHVVQCSLTGIRPYYRLAAPMMTSDDESVWKYFFRRNHKYTLIAV